MGPQGRSAFSFRKCCGCPCSPSSWPQESSNAVTLRLYLLTVSPAAGQPNRLRWRMCFVGFPAALNLALYWKCWCLIAEGRGSIPGPSSTPPLISYVDGDSGSSAVAGTLRHWPCTPSRDKTSLFFCIVPFFPPKGNVRETKGNFCP